jgi:hypothetical protein
LHAMQALYQLSYTPKGGMHSTTRLRTGPWPLCVGSNAPGPS